MPLDIVLYTIGLIETNTYLVADRTTGRAVLIDPAEESSLAVREVIKRGWDLTAIWLTHAHFDHFAGTGEAVRAWGKPLPVGVHPDDLPLWQSKGDAPHFGVEIDQGPEPTLFFEPGVDLMLGESAISVLFVPGHTRGHVVFYSAADKTAFVGDVIFAGSIGRTDLPGADYSQLVAGIRREILALPDDTRLLPGHGPATTVGNERKYNPFIRER
jgi:hydroxyacylglutathione hydrolase